jgi:hypothetical protein
VPIRLELWTGGLRFVTDDLRLIFSVHIFSSPANGFIVFFFGRQLISHPPVLLCCGIYKTCLESVAAAFSSKPGWFGSDSHAA